MSETQLPAFLTSARLAAIVVFAIWGLGTLWIRRPVWVLGGVLGWCAYLWSISTLPLGRIYALGVGNDRLNNLALCTPVAAGAPFWETYQVGQLNWEPFWSLFTAALSGWNADRLLRIYPYLPLLVVVGFAMSLYAGLRPAADSEGDAWSAWERAFAVFFALLLSTAPLDYEGRYRANWSVNFLLKPNHALGLVLVPLVLALFARLRSWGGRLAAGVLLHLLGWVFVLHWVYVSASLFVYLGITWLKRRELWRKAFADVATAVGLNLLIVSPYLVMLLIGYPFTGRAPESVLPSVASHFLEATLDQGIVFFLALWGGRVLYRRGDALSRLWLALAISAFGIWLAYLGLSWMERARETDEIYYFLRVVTAVLAGIGAWNLAESLVKLLEWPRARGPAGILLLSLPLALPSFWDPWTMDSYFVRSVSPLPDHLVQAMAFIRAETRPGSTFIAGGDQSRFVAALGGRRLLSDKTIHQPKDVEERAKLERALMVENDRGAAAALQERYGVRYVLVSPGLLREHAVVTWNDILTRPGWTLLRQEGDPQAEFLAIFRIEERRLARGGKR
jgi:hypothetical protein